MKMTKSRWLMSTLVVASVALGLVGTQPALSAKKKIVFWHFWGGTRIPLMNKMISDFEKKNPDIKVEHTFIDPNSRVQKFLATVVAGAPPDVIMLGRQDVPAFVLRQVIKPLDEYMKRDKVNPDIFVKSEFSQCRYQGKTWIIPKPTGGGLHLMYYNKQVFKEVGLDPSKGPHTWQELELYSRKCSQMGANGALKRIGYSPWVAKDHYKPYLYSNRGKWLSDDGRTCVLDSPQAAETIKWMNEFWTKVYDKGKFSVADSWNKGAQAMVLDGTWQIFYMVAAKAKIDYGIDLIPHNEGAESHGTIDGGWGYCIPGNAKRPQDSWKLIKYLTIDPAGAGWFYKEQMRPTPVKAFNSDKFFRENVTDWHRVEAAMDADIPLPITPVNPELDAILERMISQVISRKLAPEAAVRWGQAESQKVLTAFWNKVSKRK